MSTMANPQGAVPAIGGDDPFVSTPPHAHPPVLRYSSFDNDNFSVSTSPAQAKRALEAHMKETDRRIQDASRLGTSLLQQRKELAARLKELEQQKDAGQIEPELQKKLTELEREYTEVGRETARAFLPKSRIAASESADPTMSPAVFSADSRASPSKVAVPSRRQRNQPSARVHDIEFATEISTSLLAQVRQLQAALVEKDDALRQVTAEHSQLEMDHGNMRQRLRHLDDNEQKFKDENWNLETQLQELTAAHREVSDREQRLNHSLKVAHTDKESSLRELEDLRQSHGKLSDDHTHAKRQHESDLHVLRRDIAGHEHERDQLQKKVEELTSQNTELARAVALRWNDGNQNLDRQPGSGEDDSTNDRDFSEYSPPPSPTKGGARQGVLETETLKSSLQHAHRMIQNLKNNIHREKTEKIELKRMLQDARDELESRRGDSNTSLAKKRRSEQENARLRRKGDQLGASRMSREEIIMDDPDWEDHNGEDAFRSSTTSNATARPMSSSMPGAFTPSEESTDAFETANEKESTTETEAFQTGNEDMQGDSSGDATETEAGGNKRNTITSRMTSLPDRKAGNRSSFMSTASTSADEDDDIRTPAQAQQPRYKLRNRSSRRNGRYGDLLESGSNNSPAFSHTSSNRSTPQAAVKNLGDELDGLSDEEGTIDGTPSRTSVYSGDYTPESAHQRYVSNSTVIPPLNPLPSKPAMVDSGMMTESWQPESTENKSIIAAAAGAVGGLFTGIAGSKIASHPVNDDEEALRQSPEAVASEIPAAVSSVPQKPHELSSIISQHTEPVTPPRAAIPTTSNILAQHTEPSSPPRRAAPMVSGIMAQHTEPMTPPRPNAPTASGIMAQQTEPMSPPRTIAPTASGILSQHTEPMSPPRAIDPSSSGILSQHIEPTSPPRAIAPSTSGIVIQHTEPITPSRRSSIDPDSGRSRPAMALSSIFSQDVGPSTDAQNTQMFPPRRSSRRAEIDPTVVMPGAEAGPDERPMTANRATNSGLESRAAAPAGAASGLFAQSSRPNTASREPSMLFGDSSSAIPSARESQESSGRLPFAEVSNNAQRVGSDASVANMSSKPTDNVYGQGPNSTLPRHERGDARSSNHNVAMAAGAGAVAGASAVAAMDHFNQGSSQKATANTSSPRRSSEPVVRADNAATSRRPGSSGSLRRAGGNAPPLPPDHFQKIVAANGGRAPTQPAASGTMGPPIMPASAYKTGNLAPSMRSRSNSVTQKTPSLRGGSMSRPVPAAGRLDIGSPISRQTSVSSFVSEVDHRFNPSGAFTYPADAAPGTDPRMIQAITQTMIGEYLWKYTRKAGRSEVSGNRHRRFFWIHPYTRTLYWSETDPATAGRQQLKAKSVAIESVRVVTDDNLSPPGLHNKSLVVVSPGREVVFTAPTSQRHQVWFNALTYLLLRAAPESSTPQESPNPENTDGINDEDIAEFNPQYGNRSTSRATGRTSRVSLSSYNSRTTQNSTVRPHHMDVPTLTQRRPSAPEPSPRHAKSGAQQDPNTPLRGTPGKAETGTPSGRLSSLSGVFNSMRGRGSVSSRRSGTSLSNRVETTVDGTGIYDASVVGDSQEDLRAIVERQEREAGRLENVRACCDGKSSCSSPFSVSRKGEKAVTNEWIRQTRRRLLV